MTVLWWLRSKRKHPVRFDTDRVLLIDRLDLGRGRFRPLLPRRLEKSAANGDSPSLCIMGHFLRKLSSRH